LQIIDAGADYLLAVKENQPTLYAEMENFFDQAHAAEWEEVPHLFHQTVEKDHGRIETREVRVIEGLSWLPYTSKWKNLAYLIEVHSTRKKTGSAIRYALKKSWQRGEFLHQDRGEHYQNSPFCHDFLSAYDCPHPHNSSI
jgi:hypothetical protein